MAFFLSLLSSPDVTFLPEGVVVGFRTFAWGFDSQKNKIWVERKNLVDPPVPGRVDFLGFFQKKKSA
jgi:hypothetical protein